MGAIAVDPLVAAWAAWLTVGAALAFWYYRVRQSAMGFTVVTPASNRTAARPTSGVRLPVKPQPPTPPPPRPDAFEELQTLLDGPDGSVNNQ